MGDFMHSAQLRKMRLAILKWRFDYMREAKAKAREITLRRQQVARNRRPNFNKKGDFESETASGPGGPAGKQASVTDLPPKKKINEVVETLQNAQKVLAMIWQRLPADEESARNFLSKAEKAVPMTPEVLVLYEEYLEEHGILPALRQDEFAGDGSVQDPGIAEIGGGDAMDVIG